MVIQSPVFIGVDGGGTKTSVVVERENKIIGRAQAGAANIGISVEQSWNSIEAAIGRALVGTGLSLGQAGADFILGAGVAGTEFESAAQDFNCHPSSGLFSKVILESDGYVACLGAHAGRDGGIVNIGTGIVGYQVIANSVSRWSGWGFPLADEGSGAWVGMRAIQGALQMFDGRREATPFLDEIAKTFDHSPGQLLEQSQTAPSSWFAEFAPHVFAAARDGDALAVGIATQAADEVRGIIRAMRESANQKNCRVALALVGGLAESIAEWLEEGERGELAAAQADATTGALYLAKQHVSV